MKKIYKYLILSLPLVIIISLLIIFLLNDIVNVDNYIISNITKNLSYSMIEIMKIITTSCSAIIFLLIILLVMLNSKNKKLGMFFLLDIIICYLINLFIKNVVARPRPFKYMLIYESGYSFPSAHSMLAVAFYGYLIFIVLKYIKRKDLKIFCIAMIVFLTILVGVSRVCLGVHYPSDVLCGFLLGYIYILVYLKIVKKYI